MWDQRIFDKFVTLLSLQKADNADKVDNNKLYLISLHKLSLKKFEVSYVDMYARRMCLLCSR